MTTDLAHLLLTVLLFALASMVSPLAIIAVMAVLSATKRRAFKALLFAITYATVFSTVSLLLVAIESAATSGSNISARNGRAAHREPAPDQIDGAHSREAVPLGLISGD